MASSTASEEDILSPALQDLENEYYAVTDGVDESIAPITVENLHLSEIVLGIHSLLNFGFVVDNERIQDAQRVANTYEILTDDYYADNKLVYVQYFTPLQFGGLGGEYPQGEFGKMVARASDVEGKFEDRVDAILWGMFRLAYVKEARIKGTAFDKHALFYVRHGLAKLIAHMRLNARDADPTATPISNASSEWSDFRIANQFASPSLNFSIDSLSAPSSSGSSTPGSPGVPTPGSLTPGSPGAPLDSSFPIPDEPSPYNSMQTYTRFLDTHIQLPQLSDQRNLYVMGIFENIRGIDARLGTVPDACHVCIYVGRSGTTLVSRENEKSGTSDMVLQIIGYWGAEIDDTPYLKRTFVKLQPEIELTLDVAAGRGLRVHHRYCGLEWRDSDPYPGHTISIWNDHLFPPLPPSTVTSPSDSRRERRYGNRWSPFSIDMDNISYNDEAFDPSVDGSPAAGGAGESKTSPGGRVVPQVRPSFVVLRF